MYACDFRFPLPNGSRFMKTDSVEGGFDTINGLIYVTMTNGTPANLTAYDAQLKSYRLEEGGWVTADLPDNFVKIRFSYFGDY